MAKWVYSFARGQAEGSSALRDKLGGKGANLAEMCNLGLPVPPGFTITTEACTWYFEHGNEAPPELEHQVESSLEDMECALGQKFGCTENPLFVSVRSGARASMPGMMDTILNLGLNDETALSLAERTGDPRFAYDCYRRFIEMYATVVLGLEHEAFDALIEERRKDRSVASDAELNAQDWQHVVRAFKELVEKSTGTPFPQDPRAQLWAAIRAVFQSWMNPRAAVYRRLNGIPASWGTAVNIQAMVFGNRGEKSATGVVFTRDPSSGTKMLYGEFLVNAQGEDVVAGIRTPQSLTERARIEGGSKLPSMETVMPAAFQELKQTARVLEDHFRDMQDMEFTIEEGKLWMLQTRAGKRAARAALRIAVEMANEGMISRNQAVARIDPAALDQLLHPAIAPGTTRDILAKGLPASPGAATGEIVFSADDAEALTNRGKKVILVRIETSPDDISGMHVAAGVLTTRGGMTSHAAVVARGMGKPCICGAGTIQVDYKTQSLKAGEVVLRRGDWLTLDGTTGEVMRGELPMQPPETSVDLQTILDWADAVGGMTIRANADTIPDAQAARSYGAKGIGLCRTEHMFFEGPRIIAVREMILAESETARSRALAKLLVMQREDFAGIFSVMSGFPVTVRLLDPPLHEFLPHSEEEIGEVAGAMNVNPDILRRRAAELREANPMLGFRGCRLAIAYPEIAEMQARALFEGAVAAKRKTGQYVDLEIMVPLVAAQAEFDIVRALIDTIATVVAQETGERVPFSVGTMVELPRACILAGSIAETADFFSFGTNDLTQTVLGISRDDSGAFLPSYVAKGIFKADPFMTIDKEGVGEFVKLAAESARAAKPQIKLGVCGEHGGDPSSINFFAQLRLAYVSCSPYRVPVARLAAAQAALAIAASAAKTNALQAA